MGRRGTPYYAEAMPPVEVNKSTEWFMYFGVWTTYILLLFFAWLIVLSVSGCSLDVAWTVVNLAHFALLGHDMGVVVPAKLFTQCMLRVVRLNLQQRSAKSH